MSDLRSANGISVGTLVDWDSLAHLQLYNACLREFMVDLDPFAFESCTSFDSILQLVIAFSD